MTPTTTALTSPVNALSAAFLKAKHAAGLSYDAYVATDPTRAPAWKHMAEQVSLKPEQRTLVEGFVRHMPVLCISGTWCGDCSTQAPMLHAIASANRDCIDLRFLDRDHHRDLADLVMINAGHRVPTVIFMAEDYEPVSIVGDRTLSRYRAIAARQLGPSCPLPGAPVPQDELDATLQEWLDEFERVHLLLRLSARLREKHGD